MNKIIITRWSDQGQGVELTEAAVREAHQPSGHYRITSNRYPPGTGFHGASRGGTLYILGGECRFKLQEYACVLSQGDVVQFPSGDYQLDVLGDNELHTINVWQLPDEFRT